jgi:nitroreductase
VSAIESLLSRRSIAPQYLTGPGPTQQQIDMAIDSSLRAPDHGRIQPWRFRLIRGDARSRFADALVGTMLRRDPNTAAAQLQKIRQRAEVPLIVAACASLQANSKVPEVEQILAAGCGVMNLLNAFHIQGLGAVWLTGASVYEPDVSALIGLKAEERLLGFVYVGTPAANVPESVARPSRQMFVSDWAG